MAATHTFLTPAEIEAIAPQAQAGLEGIETLVVLEANGQSAGFMVVRRDALDSEGCPYPILAMERKAS